MNWGKRTAILTAATLAIGLIAAPPAHANTNTGQPGSTCRPHDGGVPFLPPNNGESTVALGVDAPAYYEVGPPTGEFAGKRPKAFMLVIHGGGWHLVGKGTVGFERRTANPWRARGWETINIDYRGCARSLDDVLWFKRRVRLLHPHAPICAVGISAGGHLALMLAAVEPDIACVISLGGPTDLLGISGQTAYDPRVKTFTTAGPSQVGHLAKAAFGADVRPVNPIRHVSNTKARFLLASAEYDPLIPVAQNRSYAAALRHVRRDAYVDVQVLPLGPIKTVHSRTTQAALDDLRRREDRLVAPLVAWAPLVPSV